MAVVYYASRALTHLVYHTLGRLEVEGQEAVPPKGPVLIVSNHLSNPDPVLVAASIPRRVYFMAKKELYWGPLITAILNSYGAHPVARDGPDLAATRWAIKQLRKEQVLCIFPESARSKTATMQRALPGVAYLAQKTQAPILPVAVTGTQKIPGLWRVALPLCRVKVTIGQPFTLPRLEGHLTKPLLQEMADMIMMRVAMLLPPRYRGFYGDVSRVADRPPEQKIVAG